MAVRFTDGNSLENCTVTVDGTDVTSACTPVTDDGSLVKWEITALNPAKVVISKGSQRQTVALTDNANPTAPAVGEKAETYYFLTNGPVYVWDYHLTNYDAAGQGPRQARQDHLQPDQPGRGCHCILLSRCGSEEGRFRRKHL